MRSRGRWDGTVIHFIKQNLILSVVQSMTYIFIAHIPHPVCHASLQCSNNFLLSFFLSPQVVPYASILHRGKFNSLWLWMVIKCTVYGWVGNVYIDKIRFFFSITTQTNFPIITCQKLRAKPYLIYGSSYNTHSLENLKSVSVD